MDQLPWIEKYRPTEFDSIILDELNQTMLKEMLNLNLLPNLIFYGPPGTGKTTTIVNFINAFQKKNNQIHKELIIHLNASDDRGIETIRNQIFSFTNTSYLFNKGIKFIVLDEVDYMTKNAQFLLYTLMKDSNHNVRFCLICNYISKLDHSLKNLCMPFKFNVLPKPSIFAFIKNICEKENIKNISDDNINDIIELFNSDIRSMINYLQRQYKSNNDTAIYIISNDRIKELISSFTTESITKSVEKVNYYMYNYNIEKQELIIYIFKYISQNYKITKKGFAFFKSILHNNNYYVDGFNKFFISNVVSLLRE